MLTDRFLVGARVALILALIVFVAVMVIHGHPVWGGIGLVMAIIASLSPVKGIKGD